MASHVGRLFECTGCLVLLLQGCGAKSVELDRLIHDGRDNEVRAVAKYQKRRIQVTGTVAEVGMTKVERFSATHTAYSRWLATSKVHRGLENHPYVVLKSSAGDSEDSLVCYFDPDDVDEVSEFTDGSEVTLEGKFQEYSEDEGVMMAVLRECREK